MQARIKDYIYSHKEELLTALAPLIGIPSVKGEPQDGAPFGIEPKRALDEMCRICGEMGFATEVCENVAGSADYVPDGADITLGILCHLDVVPCEPESWATDPYKMTEKDGVLYGRGVIDDKGPAIAALFAMRCIKELGLPLKKGVRLIFGTDEENGSADMDIYKKHVQLPPNVFTPDGSFPVINVEKGMMRSFFKSEYEGGSVRCFHGGSIPNAVPDKAYAVVDGASAALVSDLIAQDKSGAAFTVTDTDGAVRIDVTGVSAHASTPESGTNVITALISLLNRLDLNGKQAEMLRGLEKAFPFGETDGASVGIKAKDNTGATTCVLSIFNMENGMASGTVDVRFPTCLSLAEVEKLAGGDGSGRVQR